jgi:hypothetical protein
MWVAKKFERMFNTFKNIYISTSFLANLFDCQKFEFFTKRLAKFLYMGHVGSSQKIWKDV